MTRIELNWITLPRATEYIMWSASLIGRHNLTHAGQLANFVDANEKNSWRMNRNTQLRKVKCADWLADYLALALAPALALALALLLTK